MSYRRSRRELFRIMTLSAAGWLVPGWVARAAALLATKPLTEGPFYPRMLPLDDDNDLTQVKGVNGVAKGIVLDLTGRVVDAEGRPLAGTQVEIWQCNAFGRYHHPDDHSSAPLDPGFQGHGKTVTDADGRYRFRTIKPVPYPGRTPHIHFRLASREAGALTTQMFVAGEAGNERDGIFRQMQNDRTHQPAVVALTPAEKGSGAELRGEFQIVLPA